MLRVLLGVFMVLHGIVYFLYLGQSARRFALSPGMIWPDGSWAFSRRMEHETLRTVANFACGVVAVGFIVGGIGLLADQNWWRVVIVLAAALGGGLAVVFWDGKLEELADQGAIGLLINLIILAALLVFHWPPVGF